MHCRSGSAIHRAGVGAGHVRAYTSFCHEAVRRLCDNRRVCASHINAPLAFTDLPAPVNSPLQYLFARYALPLAFVVGVLLSFAFAPYDVWPLAILCPAYLFFVWQGATPKHAAVLGFWFNAGTFGAGTYWLYHSIHTIGGAPIWVALFLMLALVAIMGLYLALLGYTQARLLPATGALRWLIGLPTFWVLLEWWRGWFASGFPWLSLGYAQIDSPLGAFAPLLGVYGISLTCVLCAGALLALVLGSRRERMIAAAA